MKDKSYFLFENTTSGVREETDAGITSLELKLFHFFVEVITTKICGLHTQVLGRF